MASVACEVMWIQFLLKKIHQISSKVPTAWVDNQGAISLAGNPVFHSRKKDLELDLHFIREKIARKEIQVLLFPSLDQITYIFTKPLVGQFFYRLRNKLNIGPRGALELKGHIKMINIGMHANKVKINMHDNVHVNGEHEHGHASVISADYKEYDQAEGVKNTTSPNFYIGTMPLVLYSN